MALKLNNLDKSFETLDVLRDVNATIEQGEFVSIVGPSGCGKSTLLNIIAGIMEQDHGTIENDGEDNRSFVFQSPRLLEWRTVAENLRLALKPTEVPESEYDRLVTEYLEMMNLEDIRDSYPGELSGGMKSRVSLIRGVIVPSDLILMDEPLGDIDELTARKIREELLDLRKQEGTDKTILYVTHNIFEAVYLSDRIMVMGEKPSNFVDIIDVDIDRPRDPENEEIFTTQNKVFDSLPD
jgi:NitT/TauT family transport system ATP-binding protein